MPLMHCNDCHHEFEAVESTKKCDWCGAEAHILEEETPLESLIKSMMCDGKCAPDECVCPKPEE